MTQCITYHDETGLLAIIHPNYRLRKEGESEADFLKRIWARNVETAKQITNSGRVMNPHLAAEPAHEPLDVAKIPADRSFRNAWVLKGGEVQHDMEKAREVHRKRVRIARVSRLIDLDVAVSRALVSGDADAVKVAEAERQKLRDAPADPRIDAAKTIEDLSAIALG